MVLEGFARYVSYERSRSLIYVRKKVTDDSAFPFKHGDELVVRIEGKRLVFEKATGRNKPQS